jgi:aldehyde dehydrogenase (NAD+)
MSINLQEIEVASRALRIGREAFDGSGDLLVIDDPSTGETIAELRSATAEDVDRLVSEAATCATNWRRSSPVDRADLCRAIAEEIRYHADRLTEIAIHDAGLPVSLARRDIAAAARYFDYYAGVAETLGGRTTASDTGGLVATVVAPWGVCGIILPFNLPFQLAARDLAPALAMGNTAVLKAPEQTPFAALAITELCEVAGAPRGLVCAAVGRGDAGAALVDHPDIAHVTFTGSHRTGAAVMQAAGRRVAPSTIELGGKSPHVVFADADFDAAAAAIVQASMPTAGQACSAGTRVLVDARHHDALAERISRRLSSLSIGPAAEDPNVGPVVSAHQQTQVMESITGALAGGARLLAGGESLPSELPSGGHYVLPTLLTTDDAASPIVQTEVFGPVVTMMGFESERHAVELANGTPFGLVAGVWTQDLQRALRVGGEVDAGQVYLNGYAVGGGIGVPFGGMKASGVGRVKGVEGALEYAQVKTLVFPGP